MKKELKELVKLLKKGKGLKQLKELDNPEFEELCLWWAENEMSWDGGVQTFFSILKDENERRGYPCGGGDEQ